ncbi:MAG: serine/threonine protein kinase [Deltaproteobacteria bacterium]|nr:serine/threonine protein kinase [Deltaproteobacteria bacterium]
MAEPSAGTKYSGTGAPAIRIGRALASPIGVLVTIPLLVIAVGLGILLLGRDATRTATGDLVRRQLSEQARSVQADVAFALDQAGPLMARTRVLAERRLERDAMLLALHDLIVGRPGVSYISVSFPDGTYFHANTTRDRVIEVQQSQLTPTGTRVEWFTVVGGAVVPKRDTTNAYDPRKRPFWELAVKTRDRAWAQPYTFAMTFDTGITCTEPIYDKAGALAAVLTVDFDIATLSSIISREAASRDTVARPTLDDARTIVYTGDGTILAYPAGDKLAIAKTDQLLSYKQLNDPALEALFAEAAAPELRLLDLGNGDDGWLASVAPVGGQRAGVAVPLDWYVATIVPVKTLLGPTRKLERSSAIASAGALLAAVLLSIVLAWNLVRMRRQVAASRAEARSAQARAKELGSYRLVAKLGAGGMGEVWRAEHRMLARTAAIKLIRPEALERDPANVEEIRERFRREAQTLASMRSRHTIEIFDYGVTEAGVFYFVMELLDGVDLESLIVRYGAQSPARVIQLLIQACSSLAEAHDAGLLHRDIKPPNLFISRAADEVDIVKLLDFGIVQTTGEIAAESKAKAVIDPSVSSIPTSDKLTQLGAMVGTPGFMAPEQILGMELDGRADLYALGCCAWWLLTGEEVFRRDEGGAKFLHKHIYDPVPSLRIATRGWCPPQLEEVIASCLAKEPERRPANARALADKLKAIPIPTEQQWTDARAHTWWNEYKPPVPVTPPTASNVQVIMPGTVEQRPASATSEAAIGPTIGPR